MRVISGLFLLLFFGCNYLLVNPDKYSSIEKVNYGLLDTVKIDTTGWARAYGDYVKKCNPTNRKFDILNEIIQNNAKVILNSCNRYAQKLDVTTFDTVLFNLSSDGLLMISSMNSKTLKDTTEWKAIRKSLADVKFGASKEGKYSCAFSAVITQKDTSQEITMNPDIAFGQGARSKADIMKTVMNYVGKIRFAYNRRLVSKLYLHGKLVVKFAINQYGRVISVQKDSSSLSDEILEGAVMQQIKHWRFEPILTDKDITEVIYPFVFSN